jgi:hypothetical protein
MNRRILSRYKRTSTLLLAAVIVAAGVLHGCARFNVPEPHAPLKPLIEPTVRDSTISLPITFSVSSLMNSLGLPPGSEDPERDSRIAGKIRGFLQRQTNRKDDLAQSPFLHQQVGKVWDMLQNPIRLKNGLLLFIRPKAVSLSPVAEEGETVRVVAGLVARPVLVSDAAAAPAPQPLPVFTMSPAPLAPGFHVALRTELSYEQLSRELTERLQGRSFTQAGHTVVVETMRVYGSGESVVLAAAVSGYRQGTVYLSGTPVYDPASQTLSLGGVDYTIGTRRVLNRMAAWILRSELQKNISSRTTWYVGDKIEQARADLEAALNRSVSDQVNASMTGTVTSLRLIAVGMTERGIAAFLETDGSVEMHVY